jgi:prolyl 4-hydroxylase
VLHNNRSAESINVVFYGVGQEYTAHYDTISDGTKTEYRFISPLLYFNTPDRGGSTSFPKAGPNEEGVHVPAVKGNLMFFYDLLEDGNIDSYSVHAGTPVLEGEKWIGAAWIWDPQLDFGSSSKEQLAAFSAQQHEIMKRNLEEAHTEL